MTSQPPATASTGIAQMDAHTVAARLADGSPVLIPVGATEQHGPHLPIGTDAMLSTAMATGVAERIGGLVMPAFVYGYKSQQKSGGGDHLTGSTSVDAATLIGITRDVVASLLRQGARRLVLVNGHFENYQFLYEGVDLALRDLDAETARQTAILLLSYWDYVSDASIDHVYPQGFPGWEIEHGGVLETSLMLHLHPDLVAMDRAPQHGPAQPERFDRLPVVASRTPESGCLSSPTGSSADNGRVMAEQVIADLAEDLRRELALG